jgi:hypothetical protein
VGLSANPRSAALADPLNAVSAQAIAAAAAGLEEAARGASDAATVHIALVPVQDQVVAAWGQTQAVTNLALAVHVPLACAVVLAGVAATAAVEIRLRADFQGVVAGVVDAGPLDTVSTLTVPSDRTEFVGRAGGTLTAPALQIGFATVQRAVVAVAWLAEPRATRLRRTVGRNAATLPARAV